MKVPPYDIVLKHLTLSYEHQQKLAHRGFPSFMVELNGYKTFPYKRGEITEKILEDLQNPEGVPGFWREKNGKWQLAGSAGLVIPVRNFDGSIHSLKIRSDSDQTYGKYTTLSSNPKPNKDGISAYPNGTAAKISVHFPLEGKKNAYETLVITEGELKADLTCIMKTDWYCISLPGVTMWEWGVSAAETLKPKKVLLAFDADKNKEVSSSKPEGTPFIVAKSLANLYLSLKQKNIDVHILDWDIQYGKGIDDVLSAGFSDKIKTLTPIEAEEFCKKNMNDDLVFDWVYVVGVQRFFNMQTGDMISKDQFSDKFSPNFEKGKAADATLKRLSFPRVDHLTYLPGKLKIFEEKNKKYLNTWEPSTLEEKSGEAKLFYDHVSYLLPDETEQSILLDWLAFNIQKPGEKMMWAVLIQGEHGIGKSYFCEMFKMLIGENNIAEPSNEELKCMYTGWMQRCSLVVIHEVLSTGKIETMNKLKTLITEKNVRIHEKYMPSFSQPNCANFLLLTNNTDSIFIERTERRYCVFQSPSKPKDKSYFETLFNWTKKNAGEILYQLKNRDLTEFKPYAHAPHTAARDVLVEESLTVLESWIKESVEDFVFPFKSDVVSITDIANNLPKFIINGNPKVILKAFKRMGFASLGQRRLNDGRIRLWAVRNHLKWSNVSNDLSVEEYLNGFKTKNGSYLYSKNDSL